MTFRKKQSLDIVRKSQQNASQFLKQIRQRLYEDFLLKLSIKCSTSQYLQLYTHQTNQFILMESQAVVIPKDASSRKAIDVAFTDITYTVQIQDKAATQSSLPCYKQYIGKQLLKGISGIFKSGEVTAIMGASGAGKTTLLNVLSCRVSGKLIEGKLYANNKQYNYENFGDFANYVMQNDVLMSTLTVRETLQFAANLKLNKTKQEKKERIDLLCQNLKLEKCLDVLVGGNLIKGVSGGQKKRTSIAFELISDPQVIILDEPTSGLDSLTSYIIIRYLKHLANVEGKTVFMTIHQPNSQIFQLFDRLILLVQGKLIYQGRALEATSYFSQHFGLTCPEFSNPADYFMSIMHHESVQNRNRYPAYFQAYEKHISPIVKKMIQDRSTDEFQKRVVELPLSTTYKALVDRDLKNTLRNPLLVKSRIIQTIFISIFTGGVYCKMSGNYTDPISWFKYIGFFFFVSIGFMMLPLSPIAIVFPQQRTVFLKEQGAKLYGVTAYFISRNLIQIPYSFIFPFLMSVLSYWFIGLHSQASTFFIFYLIGYLCSFNGMSLGLLIGSIMKDTKSVSSFLPIIIIPLFVFAGVFKNTGNLPDWIGWIQYISPLKYTFSAFVQNQVQNVGASNVDQLNFNIGLWGSVGCLVGLGLAYRVLSLFFLWLLRTRLE